MANSYTYTQAKAALTKNGFSTSAGSNWNGEDAGSLVKFIAQSEYKAGVYPSPQSVNLAQYGFAYPGVMPASVAASIVDGSYSATLAGSPLTGTHGTTAITWTLTETGGNGTSFSWDLGDGSGVQVTTVPHITYTYPAAGSFTAKCTPTVDGVVTPQVTAAAPAVIA